MGYLYCNFLNKNLCDKEFSKGEQTNSWAMKNGRIRGRIQHLHNCPEGKKKMWGKTWESESPQEQGFNCNLSKKWAAVGRLQSGGSKGLLGASPRSCCYLSMSVCTYIYMCTDALIIKESANKLCRILIYDITRSQ